LFSIHADGRSPRTLEYYRKLLGHFLRYADSQRWPKKIDSVDTTRVRQFLSWIGSRNYHYIAGNNSHRIVRSSPSLAWPYYKALRRLFNWDIEQGFIDENPIKSIHFSSLRSAPIEGFCKDEIRSLLSICDLGIGTGALFTGIRNKAMLLLFLDSGLCRSEMANLNLSDLNLKRWSCMLLVKETSMISCHFLLKQQKHFGLGC